MFPLFLHEVLYYKKGGRTLQVALEALEKWKIRQRHRNNDFLDVYIDAC